MPSPVTFNPQSSTAMLRLQNTRMAARPGVQHDDVDFGAKAQSQTNANKTCALPCGLGTLVALVPIIAYMAALHLMTPKELKDKNMESVTVSRDANDAVVAKSLLIRSRVNETVKEGVLKFEEKSGLFGFFKKATLTYDGTPATTTSIRTMFLPPYVKHLLLNGPDELGSPRKWDTTKDAMKLGDVDVPKGAKLATNVYGEQLAVFKQGRHSMVGGVNLNGELTATFKRDDDYVVVGPTEIGKKDSPIIKKTYTPDKVPALVQRALRRQVFGPIF